ncbi:MAG: response regulator [Candidatus Neomarinimicrobiota bacterium]
MTIPSGENFTVLVVEDNTAHLEYLTYLLKKRDINVVSANNAQRALKQLKGLNINCALLDINLGHGMSGIQLMYKLRQMSKYKNIPIISVTAYYGRENKEAFINYGFTDFIAKPFNYNQLDEMLHNHLYFA